MGSSDTIRRPADFPMVLETERPISIPLDGGLFATVTVTAAGRGGLELVVDWWGMMSNACFYLLLRSSMRQEYQIIR